MSPTLRILLVGPTPPPAGGMANQTRQLERLLEDAGFTVMLESTTAPYRPTWIQPVRGVRSVFRLIPYLRRIFAQAGRADVAHVMANSGWAWHLFAVPAIWVASSRGVPVVVNYRGGLADGFLASQARIVRWTMNRATALVVPSPFLQRVFARYGMRASIIPNIVDIEMFRPRERPGGSTRGGPHIVVARNLERIYGNDIAIRAFAILRRSYPSARMSIAGSGPQLGALQSLVRNEGVTDGVVFTGRLDSQEMADLYRDADVVVNPTRADNTPNSILEALACEVPVVSTEVGGIPFLVEHGVNAWLVPPESPEDLAAGIAHVLDDRHLIRSLTENGLRLARNCSWDAVKRGWFDLYESLANRRADRDVSEAAH